MRYKKLIMLTMLTLTLIGSKTYATQVSPTPITSPSANPSPTPTASPIWTGDDYYKELVEQSERNPSAAKNIDSKDEDFKGTYLDNIVNSEDYANDTSGAWLYDNNAQYKDRGIWGQVAIKIRDFLLLTIVPCAVYIGIAAIVVSMAALIFYSFNPDRYERIHMAKVLKRENDALRLRNLLNPHVDNSELFNNSVVNQYGFYATYIAIDLKSWAFMGEPLQRWFSSGLEAFMSMVVKWTITTLMLIALAGYFALNLFASMGGTISATIVKPFIGGIPGATTNFIKSVKYGGHYYSDWDEETVLGRNMNATKTVMMSSFSKYVDSTDLPKESKLEVKKIAEAKITEYVLKLSRQPSKINMYSVTYVPTANILNRENMNDYSNISELEFQLAIEKGIDPTTLRQVEGIENTPDPYATPEPSDSTLPTATTNPYTLDTSRTDVMKYKESIELGNFGLEPGDTYMIIDIQAQPNLGTLVGTTDTTYTDIECWQTHTEMGPSETRKYKVNVRDNYWKEEEITGNVITTTFMYNIRDKKKKKDDNKTIYSLYDVGSVMLTMYDTTQILVDDTDAEDAKKKTKTVPVTFITNGDSIMFQVQSFVPTPRTKDWPGSVEYTPSPSGSSSPIPTGSTSSSASPTASASSSPSTSASPTASPNGSTSPSPSASASPSPSPSASPSTVTSFAPTMNLEPLEFPEGPDGKKSRKVVTPDTVLNVQINKIEYVEFKLQKDGNDYIEMERTDKMKRSVANGDIPIEEIDVTQEQPRFYWPVYNMYASKNKDEGFQVLDPAFKQIERVTFRMF